MELELKLNPPKTNKDLIKEIRALRGRLFVSVHSRHETHYVKVVKNDLIATLWPEGDAEFYIDTQVNQPNMHYLEPI